MAKDLHKGRGTPTFFIEGSPTKFISLIENHGVLTRLMRARKCPCVSKTGSPNMYCNLCHGDGFIYNFQRKLLQVDEDSDVLGDRTVILPFRVPVLEPLKVERLLPEEQGGNKVYNIVSFNTSSITISGNPLPKNYHKMRVSYYFDRFDYVLKDAVTVNTNTKTLTTTKTLYEGGSKFGNPLKVHGDIAEILEISRPGDNYIFTNYTFRKNKIFLGAGEPDPVQGDVLVTYFFVPVEKALPNDLDTTEDKEKWMHFLSSGAVRFGIKPWFELGQGDLITVLVSEFWRDEVLQHSGVGVDKLLEFDISRVDDEIIDENGNKYHENEDFILRPFRDIVWIGNQPNPGKRISIRYGYHPTYKIFQNNPVPNNLENKQFPNVVLAKLYNKTMAKDIETMSNPKINEDLVNFNF